MGPHAAHYTVYVPITISVLSSPSCLGNAYQVPLDTYIKNIFMYMLMCFDMCRHLGSL
jgi:hypothetical protein